MKADQIQCSSCGNEIPASVIKELKSVAPVGSQAKAPNSISGSYLSQSKGSYIPSKEKVILYTYFPRLIAVLIALLLTLPFFIRVVMNFTYNSSILNFMKNELFQTVADDYYDKTLIDIIYLIMVIVTFVISILLFYFLIKIFLSKGLSSYDYCDKAAIMIIIIGVITVANSFTDNNIDLSENRIGSIIRFFISSFSEQQTVSYMMIVGGLGLRVVLRALGEEYPSVILSTKEQSQSTPASIATGQFCTNCLSFNTMHRSTCYKCGSELNGDAVIDPSLSWQCKYCTNENGASRNYCSLCKRKRE